MARYERALGAKYTFWNLIFLRMAVPVDILSYAVGLFTAVSFKTYALATLIGITPFAFIFSYSTEAPPWVRLGAILAAAVTILLGYFKVQRQQKP